MLRDAHGRQRAEVRRERGHQRRSGGRGQFDGRTARVNRFAFEQRGGRGRGHREHAVFGLHGSAADVDRRRMDLADVEQIQRHAGAHDIGDGIHRAHFVEVNFFDRHAVDAGFGVAQAPKHIRRILFGAIGERSLVDHPQDVFQMAVTVALLAAGRNHAEFRRRDAAAAGLLHLKFARPCRGSSARRSTPRPAPPRPAARRPSCRR